MALKLIDPPPDRCPDADNVAGCLFVVYIEASSVPSLAIPEQPFGRLNRRMIGMVPNYYPLLSSVVAALENTSAEVRRRLYDSARTGFVEQMRKREPPLVDSYISEQQIAMEEAVRRVEQEHMSQPARRQEVSVSATTGIAVSPSAPRQETRSSRDETTPDKVGVDPDKTRRTTEGNLNI
jgi:hypothetical protein